MPLTRRHLLQRLAVATLAAGAGLPLRAEPRLERIVALNWVAAETLLSLGVTPLAISDDRYYRVRMPTTALPASVRDVGPYWEPNLELIQQLRPQLILSDPMTPTLERRLAAIAPTERVAIYPARDGAWRAAAEFMTGLAARLDRERFAADYLAAGERRLAELRERLARRPQPPVCVAVLNQDGRHAAVYGRGSMVQDVLDRLGLVNAWQGPVGAVGLVMVGIERLAERADAHLVYLDIPTTSARLQSLRQPNDLWANLPAVRQGHTLTLQRFYPYGGAASVLDLAERIGAYLDALPEAAHA
ncbi:ABC transporter substrate-binding protein [Pseudomonas citronellolis]|uniref:ABC transporter substrate-binding protein n=1 Tax=Pseudomonas citronellolis TaxID=53408 RepID=UPI0023E3E84A|nr:ABC transporter substrate-binding protein [Pseudomonas citronellolis]MDF3935150.1 ABC transporter substrate-binding protein [Pseudomonas citronellolis]